MRARLIVRAQQPVWIRADGTVRTWHLGYWLCVVRAVLRKMGLLPLLCEGCNGHGRVIRKHQLRRKKCLDCHGTGYARRRKAVTA